MNFKDVRQYLIRRWGIEPFNEFGTTDLGAQVSLKDSPVSNSIIVGCNHLQGEFLFGVNGAVSFVFWGAKGWDIHSVVEVTKMQPTLLYNTIGPKWPYFPLTSECPLQDIVRRFEAATEYQEDTLYASDFPTALEQMGIPYVTDSVKGGSIVYFL